MARPTTTLESLPILHKKMRENGLDSIHALSEKAAVNPTTLGDNLKGSQNISLRNALRVVRALEYDLEVGALKILKEIAEAAGEEV